MGYFNPAIKQRQVVKLSWGWLLLQPEMSALQLRACLNSTLFEALSLRDLLALKGQQMKHWPHQALPKMCMVP